MPLVDFINVGYGDAILLRETETPFAMLVDCGDARIGRPRPDGRRITAADYLRREDPGAGPAGADPPPPGPRRRTDSFAAGGPGAGILDQLPPAGGDGAHTPGSAGSSSRRPVSDDLYGDLCKALAHLRSQKTEIRLIRTPCDCRRLTETLSAGVFLEDEELRLRQASIWDAVLSGAGQQLGTWRRLTALSTTPVSACGYPMPGRRLSRGGMCMPPAGSGTSSRPAPLIKPPHHGHGDALTSRLLEMLRPRYAVISVSDDRTDDCPSKKIIQLLSQFGVECFFYGCSTVSVCSGSASCCHTFSD